MTALVVSVNISEKKGTIKHPTEQVCLKVNEGIQGDAHAGNWHRQVSLLAKESIDKMSNMGIADLNPGTFAENITTAGIELVSLPVGTHLEVGDAELEVTQIGKVCHQRCQIYYQAGMCVMPSEGIFAKVLVEGTLRAGDVIRILPTLNAAILTVSDKGYQGTRKDQSGPALAEALTPYASISHIQVVPDEIEVISETLKKWADAGGTDIIFTSGGTGLAPRDVTPEATLAVVERLVPGIPEAMRQASLEITKRAMLSRAVAGVRGRTLIINLPGSPKAALECLQVFLPAMEHAVKTLRGEAYECASP